MRKIHATALLGTVLMLVGCGSSPQDINGSWRAQLFSLTNSNAYSFSANLTRGTGASVNVSTFTFANSPSCFVAQTTQSATFNVTGSTNGIKIGNFMMTVTARSSGNQNLLSIQGARNPDGTITGTWTLTGSTSCSGNGTFTMNDGRPPV